MVVESETAALAEELALVEDEAEIRQILMWIGFSTALSRARIAEESFNDYTDIEQMKEKDVTDISDSFQKRPAAQRIIFGQRKTKKLQALIHWVKDFRRCNLLPNIVNLERATFLADLDVAARREEIRRVQIENSDSVMKEASPGPLISESKWHEWEPAFENYLSSGFGVDGVPLSYVIRKEEDPDPDAEYSDFTDRCTACAPLQGPAYDADKRKVHQYIVSFTQGQLSEDWIKSIKRLKDGRQDMLALRQHFEGEGNATRRIAQAERLRDSLFYRNERSLTFEMFLNKAQRMFNIFEQQGEPMTEEAKVRFILKKVQHPQLANSVETMRSRNILNPNDLSVAEVSNYLAARVSELPDYLMRNRNISAVNLNSESSPESGIYGPDGNIFTGYYPNWQKISESDREKVLNARKAKGMSMRRGKANERMTGKRAEVKKLQKIIAKGKRRIASLKKMSKEKASELSEVKEEERDTDDEAGNKFGGKKFKKKSFKVNAYTTSKRRSISQVDNGEIIDSSKEAVGRIELDSHADTIVAGANCSFLYYTGRQCDVSPYDSSYEPVKAVSIVCAATAWQSPHTGQLYILILNEALWMPKLPNSLVNPNQLRHFGTVVQDDPTSSFPLHIRTEDASFSMPLEMQGTVIFAETRKPTEVELDRYPHVVLSSPHEWEPSTVKFPQPNRQSLEEVIAGIRQDVGVSALGSREETIPAATVGKVSWRDVRSMGLCNCKSTFCVCTHLSRTIANTGAMSTRLVYMRSISSILTANGEVNGVKGVHQSSKRIPYMDEKRWSRSGPSIDESIDVPTPNTFVSSDRRTDVSGKEISDRWFINHAQAMKTLQKSTQRFKRSAILPLTRRYRADRMFYRKSLAGVWSTDTLDGKVKSLEQNRYAQVFANKSYFVTVYPLEKKSQAGEALRLFCREYGVPEHLIFDGSKEQNGRKTEFTRQIRQNDIDHHRIEPEFHNQNPCEGVIRELRKKWYRVMVRKKVPQRLWDYGMKWVSEIMSMTYTSAGGLNDIPMSSVTGDTIDISEYLDFGFYDQVWYIDNAGLGPRKPGRWLGVSHRVGLLMCYFVLTKTGQIISRSSVQRVTSLELELNEIRATFDELDKDINEKLKHDDMAYDGDKPTLEHWSEVKSDEMFVEEFQKSYSSPHILETDNMSIPQESDYVGMQLALPRDADGPEFASVTRRLTDSKGIPVGEANENPILDTRVYEVEYADGYTAAMSANEIAASLFAQVDDEGSRHVLLDSLVDHRTDSSAITKKDEFVSTKSGGRRRRHTTRGWEILCQWKDGSTSWEALKDLKESYPIQTAEYAFEALISEEPAFAWWVHHVMKKREKIISRVKSKYWTRTHKFGIRVPKTVREALEIDRQEKNNLWHEAIMKEMKNVRVAFEIFEGKEEDIPKGYQHVDCHMIFDIKFAENFRRKARMVGGGHQTATPAALTYSSVVSRDSVRILLTIAALHELKVSVCDIQNAYLTAPCREKIWTIAGDEFGHEKGQIMIVVRALYGLKSSGAAFRAYLAEKLWEIGFQPSQVDNDVWMRPDVKSDGFEYYEYVLCYVDDVLSISKDPSRITNCLKSTFKLKDDKVDAPEIYLGAELSQMTNEDGKYCWAMSADKYCQAAVNNVEQVLRKKSRKLPTRCVTPMSSNYRPESDISPELKSDGMQWYQEMIGALRWAVEIGRVDILHEVAVMSTYTAMPRLGHLEEVLHIFGYLKSHRKFRIMFDSGYPIFREGKFKSYEWEEFYRNVQEDIPPNKPKERSKAISISMFVDASHGSDTKNRKSQTGLLIFVNKSPIMWYSKRQPTVEVSTFGAEFCALRIGVELVKYLRYKLRMFGLVVDEPTNVFCDNEAVQKHVSTPESVLKKKHHSIAYHYCREAVAAGIIRIAHEGTETNLADLFTKFLPAGRREFLLERFTY